ncbi:hypothetical protein BD769DRAFT_492698 [Suillus cothurnatus]|nr:hypothetical protein BD769DRAFT_492698 [Suillus cothurnatus]
MLNTATWVIILSSLSSYFQHRSTFAAYFYLCTEILFGSDCFHESRLMFTGLDGCFCSSMHQNLSKCQILVLLLESRDSM